MWQETLHDQEALDGFIESLELTGIDCSIDIQRSYGDEKKALQILRTFKEEEPDLIFTVGTRGTQLAMQNITGISIIFTAVTNPVSCGIVNSWKHPGGSATGSSNWIRAEVMLRIFQQALPRLKNLGTLYDPSNPVPVAEISEARSAASKLGLALHEEAIVRIEDIVPAFNNLLAKKCTAVWVPRDKQLYQNMHLLSPVALANKIPLVSSTREALIADNSAAIMAVVADYRKLGRLSVPAALAILHKKTPPAEIPVSLAENHLILANANAARLLGFNLPPLFLARADELITGFSGQQITVAGTGDSQDLLQKIAAVLEAERQGGRIIIPDSVGSTGGLRALLSGKTDLARVARPLNTEEEQLGLTYRLFAHSPVVFVVNQSMTGINDLSYKQILEIYSGKIDNWQQLGGPAGKIYPVTRENDDSSLRVMKRVLPDFPDPSPVAKIMYSTPDTAEILEKYPNTFGFLPLATALNRKLRILRINGMEPSTDMAGVKNYPFMVPFAVVYKKQLNGLSNHFVNFLCSEQGKKLIMDYGALPIGE